MKAYFESAKNHRIVSYSMASSAFPLDLNPEILLASQLLLYYCPKFNIMKKEYRIISKGIDKTRKFLSICFYLIENHERISGNTLNMFLILRFLHHPKKM